MRLLVAVILIVGLAACESPKKPSPSAEELGRIQVRIGQQRGTIPYSDVRCWRDEGRRFALTGSHPVSLRASPPQLPDVLIGRVGEHEGVEEVTATVFDFGGTWSGERYETLTLLAESPEGLPHESECTFDTHGARHTLRCVRATPLPWQSPGGPPTAEFEVEFDCNFEEAPAGG